jgi:DnaK suppressor protein
LPLVRVRGRNYRPGNRGSQSGYRENPEAKVASGPGRSGAEILMATALSDEIDVLAKAKRAIGGDYAPSEDEPYMSEAQQDYFRRLLLEWKKSILNAAADTLQQLQDEPMREPDLNDRASSETDWGIELRTRDRQRKLIAKIDSALRRIEEGEYGYCEVTGEPIGIGRLIARPVATMTVEAQQAHERREKVSRDD